RLALPRSAGAGASPWRYGRLEDGQRFLRKGGESAHWIPESQPTVAQHARMGTLSMLIERNRPMAHNICRQDFLKIGGAAALGGVASLADPVGVIQTLEAAEPTTLHMWIWETVPHWKKVVALSGL